MRKIYLTFLFSSLVMTSAFAQKFYVRLGSGYDFPLAASMDADGDHYNGSVSYLRVNDSIYQRNYSIKKASFASGIHGDIAGGYMFNKNVGIELDVNIGISPKQYSFVESNIDYGGVASNLNIEQQAKVPVLLIPAIILQTGGEHTDFYTRLGIAVPLHSSIEEHDIVVNQPGTGATEVIDFTSVTKTKFSLGISAAAGFKFEISSRTSVYAELSILSMSLFAKQNELTNITVNGQSGYGGTSYLSTVPVSSRTTYYSNSPTVSNSSNEEPVFSIPYSSMGIHAGIVYKLEKHKHNSRKQRR